MNTPIRFAVLTVSDRCAAGEREDRGGPTVIDTCDRLFRCTCVASAIVPDEIDHIVPQLKAWLEHDRPDLILTTGGTGLAVRDITPEATLQILERRHDALLELVRARCLPITPLTYLSRGVAGTAGQTLILNLPGSPKGAREWIEALADILPHAIDTLRGDAGVHLQHEVSPTADQAQRDDK